jgi:hypothetical protein
MLGVVMPTGECAVIAPYCRSSFTTLGWLRWRRCSGAEWRIGDRHLHCESRRRLRRRVVARHIAWCVSCFPSYRFVDSAWLFNLDANLGIVGMNFMTQRGCVLLAIEIGYAYLFVILSENKFVD